MTVRIDLKSALVGLLAGMVVLLVLGAGFSGKDVDTYRLNVTSVGQEVVYTRTNTTTGKVEMWRYLVTQIPYYNNSKILQEPKY